MYARAARAALARAGQESIAFSIYHSARYLTKERSLLGQGRSLSLFLSIIHMGLLLPCPNKALSLVPNKALSLSLALSRALSL